MMAKNHKEVLEIAGTSIALSNAYSAREIANKCNKEVAAERERCAKIAEKIIVESEPEFPGTAPDEILRKLNLAAGNGRMEEVCRAVVRTTKTCIANRIKKQLERSCNEPS